MFYWKLRSRSASKAIVEKHPFINQARGYDAIKGRTRNCIFESLLRRSQGGKRLRLLRPRHGKLRLDCINLRF